MKKNPDFSNKPNAKSDQSETNDFPGYPIYPPSEDIYSKFKEEKDVDPEDITHIKTSVALEDAGEMNEKDFGDDVTGDDLDVPGSELDDPEQAVGTEDEENEYYSLGGDEHNDLEEDRGE